MTEKELLALGAPGAKRVLMVLVARQAQRVDHDVVGNLKRSAGALDCLNRALRTLVDAYWAATNLSVDGIEPVLCDIEPGDKVDRLGVALYVVPQARARLTKDLLKQIAQEMEYALLTLRRMSYELCPEGDLFIDDPGLISKQPEWLTAGEVVNSAIVPLVRLSRRHDAYVQIAERAARALEMADVPETPAKLKRTITVTGVIDGHSWSKRELVVLGSEDGEVAPSSLAGAQERSASTRLLSTAKSAWMRCFGSPAIANDVSSCSTSLKRSSTVERSGKSSCCGSRNEYRLALGAELQPLQHHGIAFAAAQLGAGPA